MSDKPVYHYEFVCSTLREFVESDGPIPTVDTVHHALRGFCKKYVFQHEKGETGYEHYQGRLSLIKKARSSVGASIAASIGERIRFQLIPTVKENTVKEAFYCLKEQTKVAGPWSDQDFARPVKKTRQMEEFESYTKYPWQETIIRIAGDWDKRRITVVVDKEGNNGKTDLCEWLVQEGKAVLVPPLRLMEDIMAMCMCKPPSRCYLIDMPRAMKKEKLFDFFSGIESLKNGYMYDKRYQFKDKWIDRPQIILFTNTDPDLSMFSKDRWDFWTIADKKLVGYAPVYKEVDKSDSE